MSLLGKRIILGISGGIAAYKAPELIRRLKEQGAEVRVVVTESAKAFVTPLTLQAVSGYAVSDDLFDPSAELSMGHIELAKWADAVLIAPATADVMARIQAGIANDLLTTICLATAAPLILAPAMNQQMYRAKVTQYNLAMLMQRGVAIWGPADGAQACGDVGPGRLLEPTELVAKLTVFFASNQDLAGVNIAITTGPTREPLDPVRYISNHSSGKMGFAIAQAAAARGANVTLISGPVQLATPEKVTRIDVTTALEMQAAVMAQAPHQHIFIGCAAIADYRAQSIAADKIKKQGDTMTVELVKNPDIIAGVGAMTENRPFVVGFAAETVSVEQYAKRKLVEKQLDLICANDVSLAGQGFNADANALHLYWKEGDKALPLTDKSQLAQQLLDEIKGHYEKYQH